MSLLDFFICQVALWVTLLTTLEIGIYSSLALAFAVLIARIARPHLTTLGKLSTGAGLYVPLGKTTDAQIELPPAGILIFRIEESFTFLNAGYVCDEMLAFIRKHTEFGGVARSKGDLLWCDDSNERFAKQQITPVKSATSAAAPVLRDSELVAAAAAGVGEDEVVKTAPATPEKPFGSPNSGTFLLEQGGALLPPLNAILLDFSAVNLLDATSYQALFDFKKSVSRYAGKLVQIHFINVKPQLKRILTNFLLVPIDVNDILPIFNNNTATLNRSLDELIASSEDAEKYFHNDIDAAVETVIQRKTTPRAKTVSEQTA